MWWRTTINSDKTNQLQMRINILKVSKCAQEETLLSSSYRTQVAEKQTKAFITRLTELYRKFKSRSWRVSEVKVRVLIGKEEDFVTWAEDVWEDPVWTLSFSRVYLTWGSSLHPQQKMNSHLPPLKYCLFCLWQKKLILHCLLNQQDNADARQNNTEVP